MLLKNANTQQSVEQIAAIGQAEHWAPWTPGTPWGTTKVVGGKVVQTSEEAAQVESEDAATMTPDQQAQFQQVMAQQQAAAAQTAAEINQLEENAPVIQP